MNVVVHNPSTADMKEARIAVPHPHFDVFKDDAKVDAYVVCHKDYLEGKDIDSCQMTVSMDLAAWDVATLKLALNT